VLHIFSCKDPFHQQEESMVRVSPVRWSVLVHSLQELQGRSCWIAFHPLAIDSTAKRFASFDEVHYKLIAHVSFPALPDVIFIRFATIE
jgi:predicted RNA-binding protein YlxR (DUF448 family)